MKEGGSPKTRYDKKGKEIKPGAFYKLAMAAHQGLDGRTGATPFEPVVVESRPAVSTQLRSQSKTMLIVADSSADLFIPVVRGDDSLAQRQPSSIRGHRKAQRRGHLRQPRQAAERHQRHASGVCMRVHRRPPGRSVPTRCPAAAAAAEPAVPAPSSRPSPLDRFFDLVLELIILGRLVCRNAGHDQGRSESGATGAKGRGQGPEGDAEGGEGYDEGAEEGRQACAQDRKDARQASVRIESIKNLLFSFKVSLYLYFIWLTTTCTYRNRPPCRP